MEGRRVGKIIKKKPPWIWRIMFLDLFRKSESTPKLDRILSLREVILSMCLRKN